jgi:ribosomal protein S18 acetylase RimI-like enzyme
MEIKQATEADVSHIVQLSHALFQEDAGQRDKTVNLNWANEQGRDYFSQFLEREQTICLLAAVDEAVVGYLAGYVRDVSAYRLVKTAELESMFIRKTHRGQGLGTALAHHFTQWAQENGAEIITVTAYTANQRAINFYQSLAFRPKQLTLALNL